LNDYNIISKSFEDSVLTKQLIKNYIIFDPKF